MPTRPLGAPSTSTPYSRLFKVEAVSHSSIPWCPKVLTRPPASSHLCVFLEFWQRRPPGVCAPSHRGILASRKAAQSRQAVTLPPDGCLESLDTGFPLHFHALSTQGPFSQVQQVTLGSENRCHQSGSSEEWKNKRFQMRAEQGPFPDPTAERSWDCP